MTNTNIIELVLALGALAIIVVASLVFAQRAKNRKTMLRERFGDEYDRAAQQYGRRADRMLAERVRHVEGLHIHALSDAERARFSSAWSLVQAQFVDEPHRAVIRANDLIKEVMRARGYRAGDEFPRRLADLSVDHPDVIEHYRAAHAMARAKAPLDTEQLRQAVVHYRVIFADLMQPVARGPHHTPVMFQPAHRMG